MTPQHKRTPSFVAPTPIAVHERSRRRRSFAHEDSVLVAWRREFGRDSAAGARAEEEVVGSGVQVHEGAFNNIGISVCVADEVVEV